MKKILFVFLSLIVPSWSFADTFPSPLVEHMQAVNEELDRLSAPVIPPGKIPLEKTTSVITRKGPSFFQKTHDWFDTDIDEKPEDSTIVPKKHQFEYARDLYLSRYEEPSVMRQKGLLWGHYLRYTYRPPKGTFLHFKELNMYRLEGQLASGKFNYHSEGDPELHVTGKKDVSFEIKGVVGRDFFPVSYLRTTPYIGLGYRYLSDNSDGLNTLVNFTNFLGYKRFSHYYFLPVGIDLTYQTVPAYSLESNFELDYVFKGYQVSKISVVPGENDIYNKQKGGFGLRASLRANRYFQYGAIFGELFVRYWNIGQSSSVDDPLSPGFIWVEPKNNTREIGLRLGLQV
jgi:hypothetical protein